MKTIRSLSPSAALAGFAVILALTATCPAGRSALELALDGAKPVSQLRFHEETKAFVPGKGPGIPDENVGDLGIALIFSQNNHWASDLWSAKGYVVTSGKLSDPRGRNAPIRAYQISPPRFSKDFRFVASGNDLFFRFPESRNYVVYSFRKSQAAGVPGIPFGNGLVVEEARIAAGDVVTGGFTLVPGMNLHSLVENRIYFYLPAAQRITAESTVARGVSVARLATNRVARVSRFTVDVSGHGTPINPAASQAGPGNPYPGGARLFCFADNDGVAVLWKDSARRKIWLTKLGGDLSLRTVPMPVCLDELVAATRDPLGNWYYLTHAKGTDPEILLVKTNRNGKPLKKRKLGAAGRSFDVASLDASWNTAQLHHAKRRICLVLARVMHNGHQGSTITLFRSSNLRFVNPPAQNASHSFDSRITSDGGKFLTMSLGDNYPRGVVLNKVSDGSSTGRVVFTYRTNHAETPRDRGDGTILPPGRWSNDNRTYTELGDIVPVDGGHAILLASEKSVSNKKTKESVNESRNLAFLLVNPRFDRIPQKEYIVPSRMVRSKGRDSRRFGFYDFGGGYVRQQNRGVIWLTRYQNKNRDNASRPKMLPWGRNKLLVLWEKWTLDSHVSTHGMVVDPDGRAKSGALDLGTLRLGQGMRFVESGGRAFGISGNGMELELLVIDKP